MKITIESTRETARANGLPVRVWTGQTEAGTPIIALITRIAVPEGADDSELAALVEAPTRAIDASGRVDIPRPCTVCMARDVRRVATHVARDASRLEWFECGRHGPRDNVAETERVELEPIEAWFDRHELPLPPGQHEALDAERRPKASRVEPSWLVKDFWILYTVAKRAHEAAMVTELDAADRGELRDALAMQLERLRPAFETCERERRGQPAPDSAEPETEHAAIDRVRRARARFGRTEANGLRALVTEWRGVDDLTLLGPGAVAGEIIGALDALAIVHGPHAEAEAAELDAALVKAYRHDRPMPRSRTAADDEALTALHRWLHRPGGDGELIEASTPFHDQVETENEGAECKRLEAEVASERQAEQQANEHARQISESIRAVFSRAGVELHIPSHELGRCGKVGCLGNRAPPSGLQTAILRRIVDEPRVSGETTEPVDAAKFLASALMGARMGWHAVTHHPGEYDKVAAVASPFPVGDTDRVAWDFGFEVATTTADPETIELVVINPNDAAPLWEQANRPGQRVPASKLPRSVMLRLDEPLTYHYMEGSFDTGQRQRTCRVCGCTNLDCSGCIAKTGVPCHWVDDDLCSACAPLVLTDAMREYYRLELCRRAPETLNYHEKRIIEAVEAEETARAESPDTWVDAKPSRGDS